MRNQIVIILLVSLLFNSSAIAQLTASIMAWTEAGCGGVCNGSISVTATSGIPPYTYLWNDPNAQTTDTATGLCSMHYTVLVTDSNGDTASVSYTLATSTGSQIDSVLIAPSTDSFSCNGSIQLFTSGRSVYSYDWSDGLSGTSVNPNILLSPGYYSVTMIDDAACIYRWDGYVPGINCSPLTYYDTVIITVVDTNYVTVTDTNFVTVTDTNYITVTVYDTTAISVTDTLIINVGLTGGNPLDTVNSIKIYPNPASTHIIIDNGNYNLMTGYTLRINNSLGQTAFSSLINQQQFNIDLSTWFGNGTYFVYIVDPLLNIVDIRKIIVQ